MRWTSSPNPPFGGFGPSFTNPRTGQILGADIMLEYIFITNYMKTDKYFSLDAAPTNMEIGSANYCNVGDYLQLDNMFTTEFMKTEGASDTAISEMVKSSVYYLVLHEMGHTMGLNHNMKASQLYSPAEINNKEVTSKTGMMGSVMDYPAVNVALDKSKQGQYIATCPGPYDKWAIEYGYSEAVSNPADEAKRLQKILARSTEPALAFGNDADDMRSPGGGIDPRVNVNDLTNDAITYSVDRIKLVQSIMGKLKQKYNTPNQSYQELRNFYMTSMSQYLRAVSVISCYVGGVYVDRAFVGQAGGGKPYTAVPLKEQKKAMDAMNKYVFSPTAFTLNSDLYNYLQAQRRGFSFFGQNEDPKIHDIVLTVQRAALDRLMNPRVMKRITDSELYGNQYKLSDVMNDLTNSIFKEDLMTNVNTYRQNLQIEYVTRLLEAYKNNGPQKYDYISQSTVFAQIKTIEKLLATPTLDVATKNHRQYLLHKISEELKSK